MSGLSFYSGPLPFKRLTATARPIRKAYRWDGAYDLFADAPAIVGQSSSVVSTGIAVAIPPGFVGQLWGRSKLASKSINPVGFLMLEDDGTIRLGGMIDAGYRKPLLVLLASVGPAPEHPIAAGDAVVQLCVVPIPDLTPQDVGDGELPPPPDDRPGGFGTSDPRGLVRVDTMGLNEEEIRRALHSPGGYAPSHSPTAPEWAPPPPRPLATSGYLHAGQVRHIPIAEHAIPSGPSRPSQELSNVRGPRPGAGRISSTYAEAAPAPPRQESPPPRGSAHYTLADRMDRSVPDYPNGAAPYSAPPAPRSPVDQSRADQWPNPPAESAGVPMGLMDALAQWQGEAPPGVGRAVEQTPPGPTLTEAWNGPFVDPLPQAPTSPVAEPTAPRASDAQAVERAASHEPTEREGVFWKWWGKHGV